jgi:chromosome segregation ATPase
LQKNNRKLETDIQKLKANVSIYEGKLTDKDAEIQKLRNRTLIQELEQARNNLKMALEKEEQTKHENANLINQINLLKEEQFTMIKKKKNNQLFELPANLNFEKKLNINVKHNIMKKVTQINQKLEEKNQKLERENEELREKLRKMLSSRNKLQKENRELKRELYVEDSDSDEGGGR